MKKLVGKCYDIMYAIASSGGKDSTFALYQAQKQGFNVKYLLHLYNPDNSRIRFHGYRKELIKKQAEAMGLEPLTVPARGDKYRQDFRCGLKRLKKKGVKGLLFGEINLEDCRKYNETIVKEVGLRYRAPLWKKPTKSILENFIAGGSPIYRPSGVISQGFKAIICSVWLKKLDKKYLGREINKEFLEDILKEKNVDPCGENGEYHSLVYNGPCFKKPLSFKIYGIHQEKKNIFLDIRNK